MMGETRTKPGWSVELRLVREWLKQLDDDTYGQVLSALVLLEERGPTLGRPLVDSVAGSRHRNMKELRPGSVGRSEVRVLFAFDPQRQAILLLGGDKRGQWRKWYRVNIPLADDLFDEHLDRLNTKETKR